MRWLVALMSSLGTVVGFGFAIATHHDRSGSTGWTQYAAVNQVRYADYLPHRGASWLPGLVVYPIAGAVGGLIVAGILASFGFRLTRR